MKVRPDMIIKWSLVTHSRSGETGIVRRVDGDFRLVYLAARDAWFHVNDLEWTDLAESHTPRNVSDLERIGVQAIEVRRARKVWLDVKRKHNAALAEYSSETGNSYIGEPHGEPDQEIDESYGDRRRAAKESVKQAAKLRAMIARYEAKS